MFGLIHTSTKRNDGFRLAWLIAVLPGITAITAVHFADTGLADRQVFAQSHESGLPSVLQSPHVETIESSASASAQQHLLSLLRIEDIEETLAPPAIQGKEFRVVVHKQRLKWPAEARHRFDPDTDETARSFEVCDEAGATVYEQKIEDAASESEFAEIRRQGRFTFTEAVYASRMQGARNQALVVSWSSLPSAPDSCATHLVLGLFGGKLVPFSGPFCEHIVPQGPDTHDRDRKLKKDPDTGFEILEVRRGYGFFHVIIPIRVDFVMARLFPARWCLRLAAPAPLAEHCEFPVETERNAATEDTFVRLFPDADETRTPRHVVVRPDSKIEFLAALAPNAMDKGCRWNNEQGGETPWLKVRVDGKEGWVRAEEDLNALGLFQAG